MGLAQQTTMTAHSSNVFFHFHDNFIPWAGVPSCHDVRDGRMDDKMSSRPVELSLRVIARKLMLLARTRAKKADGEVEVGDFGGDQVWDIENID